MWLDKNAAYFYNFKKYSIKNGHAIAHPFTPKLQSKEFPELISTILSFCQGNSLPYCVRLLQPAK